ncbi:MAG: HAMP domain-containing protein [Elusimicrobia bacterium]|nr:HAMP domain-containing protein [Elusimicrobiota bacterium]
MKMKFPFWLQLASFTLLLIAIIIISFSFQGYITLSRNYLESFEARTNSISSILGLNYAADFLSQKVLNRKETEKSINILMKQEPDISYVIFKSPSGRQIDHFMKPDADIKNVISVEKHVTIDPVDSTSGHGRRIGSIVVGYENQLIYLTKKTRNQVMLFGSIWVILGLFVSILIAYFFTRPIYTVITAMSEIAKGNVNVQVPVTRHDELGQLASTFNEMSQGLQVKNELLHYVSSRTWKEAHNRIRYKEDEIIAARKNITVLFSDICDFTKMTANVSASEIVSMLNEYFVDMTEIIQKNGGYIDKFIGDAIMAIFDGSPQEKAIGAVNAGLEMQKTVKFTLYNAKELYIKVGINFGEVVVGDIGSMKSRRDFTCIGEVVNRAQRMQSLCRPGEIVIGESVYSMMGNVTQLEIRPDKVTMKGVSEPVTIYRIGGEMEKLDV